MAIQGEATTRGLEQVVAADSALGAVDGTAGTLHYAGYSIDDLVGTASFEEVLHLLIDGTLPTADELAALQRQLAEARADTAAAALFAALPVGGDPIDAVRTAVSALAQTDTLGLERTTEHARRVGLRLTALMPVALATAVRRARGQEPVAVPTDLGQAASILYLVQGTVPSPAAVRALDAYLVLLAEHGLNASTLAARVAISAGADAYAAVTAAIAVLKGTAHGGANRGAAEMLRTIGRPERVEGYVAESLAQRRRLMGVGHRIYKTRDPRARHLERQVADLAATGHAYSLYPIARRLEAVTAAHPYYLERHLYPNVEFFSAPLLDALGFAPEQMPAVFALSRIAGWTGHILEQLADNRLIRPQVRYVGPAPRPFVSLSERRADQQSCAARA